jgi:hypothetical protein
MTRVTIYVPEATAAALSEAARKIREATGGIVSKHEALSAIIAAGVERADTALQQLRAAKSHKLGSAGNDPAAV